MRQIGKNLTDEQIGEVEDIILMNSCGEEDDDVNIQYALREYYLRNGLIDEEDCYDEEDFYDEDEEEDIPGGTDGGR